MVAGRHRPECVCVWGGGGGEEEAGGLVFAEGGGDRGGGGRLAPRELCRPSEYVYI